MNESGSSFHPESVKHAGVLRPPRVTFWKKHSSLFTHAKVRHCQDLPLDSQNSSSMSGYNITYYDRYKWSG